MRTLLLLLLFSPLLFGANIVNYNLYERPERLDLMLSFDDAFSGRLTRRTEGDYTVLQLEGAALGQKIVKHPKVPFVSELRMVPYPKGTRIEIAAKGDIKLSASKTIDRFGLRIRIRPVVSHQKREKAVVNPLFTSDKDTESAVPRREEKRLPTPKRDTALGSAYLKVIAVLAGLLLLLYLFKRLLGRQRGTKSWLFPLAGGGKSPVNVVYQKPLDGRNRVALIAYKGYLYLVLLGANNVLLDKFKNEHTPDEEEFEEMLERNSDKLDTFIRLKNEKLDAYKKKVGEEFSRLL